MVRLGMDVDVVESVGKQLRQQGQQVTALVRAVDALVDSADGHWWGGRGRDFAQQWRTVHRRSLLEAAGAVDGLAGTALENAQHQRGASASGSVAAVNDSFRRNDGALRAHPGMGRGYRNLDALDHLLDHGYTQFGAISAALGGLFTTARGTPYGNAYKKLFGSADFMRYNRSLQSLYNPSVVKILDSPLLRGADLFGKGLALVDNGTAVYKQFFDPRFAGDAALGDKFEAGGFALGSALKSSKNPVMYLSGAAVTAWSMVAAEATRVDYSPEATSQTWEYVVSNPRVIGEEFGKAAKDMFSSRIWSILG